MIVKTLFSCPVVVGDIPYATAFVGDNDFGVRGGEWKLQEKDNYWCQILGSNHNSDPARLPQQGLPRIPFQLQKL